MGAWTSAYRRGDTATAGTPRAYGILAIKAELVYRGFAGMAVESTTFGRGTDRAVRKFQKIMGLAVDGIVGPNTARALFRKRVSEIEAAFGIPDHLLCKLKSLESSNDPGATGWVDPQDRGLYQINEGFHPEVTDDLAFDPDYAGRWTGRALRAAFNTFKDWDVAIASHNVGTGGATEWQKAGKPAGTRAAEYVHLVRNAPC